MRQHKTQTTRIECYEKQHIEAAAWGRFDPATHSHAVNLNAQMRPHADVPVTVHGEDHEAPSADDRTRVPGVSKSTPHTLLRHPPLHAVLLY